jgi:NAD(P)H-hydrate epimerase
VVSLDIPSGLDATTGSSMFAIRADLTISFGHWKRGQLAGREFCGELVVLDIGLGTAPSDEAPMAIDVDWVRRVIPPIAANAHKGDRKRILIVSGNVGMAGACILAARGALRSGIGMVRCCVHRASLAPLQAAVPEATAMPWPEGPDAFADVDLDWPHAVLIGPGLGLHSTARTQVEEWLTRWTGPVVVDADALTLFAGETTALARFLAHRSAVVTPHAVEAARLSGCNASDVRDDPYAAAARLAREVQAAVLLKGVPTHVADPTGRHLVVPRGTPVLATGGSGDLLAGVLTTLLAQIGDATTAAAAAAWVHGRAAELANRRRAIRGVTLRDVLDHLSQAWCLDDAALEADELARLPAIGAHA